MDRRCADTKLVGLTVGWSGLLGVGRDPQGRRGVVSVMSSVERSSLAGTVAYALRSRPLTSLRAPELLPLVILVAAVSCLLFIFLHRHQFVFILNDNNILTSAAYRIYLSGCCVRC